MRKTAEFILTGLMLFALVGCATNEAEVTTETDEYIYELEALITAKNTEINTLIAEMEALRSKNTVLGDKNSELIAEIEHNEEIIEEQHTQLEPFRGYIMYCEKPFNRGITSADVSAYLLPYTESLCVCSGMSNVVVDVIAAVTLHYWEPYTWLLVRYDVWSLPEYDIGWIPADLVEKYTEDNQEDAIAPVYFRNGATIYFESGDEEIYSDFGSLFINPNAKLDFNAPRLIGNPICVGAAGGWSAWVGAEDIIYPEILD